MESQRTMTERLLNESRAVIELGAFGVAFPWFSLLPKGDGHPVLVLPGFGASDRSTVPLRTALRRLRYQPHRWRLGRNGGPSRDIRRGMRKRLDDLHRRYDQPVSIVGWSLGGVYARGLARRAPEQVRDVITLGSPFRSIEAQEGWSPPPVPTTSIYSKRDAVVPWQIAHEEHGPRRESIEVDSSHFGLGHHPAVVVAVADRLAQQPPAWTPFEPPRRFRHLFPAG